FSTVWLGRHRMARRKNGVRDEEISWQDLQDKVASEIIHAPKTGGDLGGGWPQVHRRIIRYLVNRVVGTPWANHLTLIAAVLSARRLDVQTVEQAVWGLHLRFSSIFLALGLKSMTDWKVELHLPLYVKGETVPDDTLTTREEFLKK